MNRFDEKYDIRLASYDEIPQIMKFIGDNWKKDHILAVNRDFFEYEHVIDGKVNFIIAKEKSETADIKGINGFLQASDDKEKLDVWTVLWKVAKGVIPFLGMEMQLRVQQITGARTVAGLGDNPNTTIKLLSAMTTYKCGKMKHFYRLSDTDNFRIAKVISRNKNIQKAKCDFVTNVIKYNNFAELINDFDFSKCTNCVPYKNGWYVNHRFFEHPIYKYQIYGLYNTKNVDALLITREQEYNGAKALRIIDYIGEQSLFAGLTVFFDHILKQYEYTDFYTFGFNEEYLFLAGFVERTEEDSNIIPNYFNPFLRQNIDIWYDSSDDKCIFFKGDADQDRPC